MYVILGTDDFVFMCVHIFVYVYMYVCMYVCMFVYLYVCMYIRITHTHTRTHTNTGLIPADLKTWQKRRPAIQPGFHKAWLDRMTLTFSECADVMLDSLHDAAAAGKIVNMEVCVCVCVCVCVDECVCTCVCVCV